MHPIYQRRMGAECVHWLKSLFCEIVWLVMLFDHCLRSLAVTPYLVSVWTLWAALGISLLGAQWAQAANNPQDTIKQAIQAGQLDQALKLVQQERQAKPKEVEFMFLEGVIQAQQGQADKAIETFKRITQAHHDLSEAYNNLGVLYAAKGRLEESRHYLEKALQTHPSYAAAHRNLSDVHSQLAKQSYAKALQIEPKTKAWAPQLTLLGSIGADKRSLGHTSPALATETQKSAAQKQPPAAVLSASKIVPATAPTAPAVTKAADPQQATRAASSDETAKPLVNSNAQAMGKTDEADVRAAVQAWAKAWSQKDIPRYFAAYSSTFTGAEQPSRTQWEADRQARIVSKKTISVATHHLKIEVKGNKAIAQFQQIYESDNFKGNSRKTLELVKHVDRWLIVRETVN